MPRFFITLQYTPSNVSTFGCCQGPMGAGAIRYRATPLLLKNEIIPPMPVEIIRALGIITETGYDEWRTLLPELEIRRNQVCEASIMVRRKWRRLQGLSSPAYETGHLALSWKITGVAHNIGVIRITERHLRRRLLSKWMPSVLVAACSRAGRAIDGARGIESIIPVIPMEDGSGANRSFPLGGNRNS